MSTQAPDFRTATAHAERLEAQYQQAVAAGDTAAAESALAALEQLRQRPDPQVQRLNALARQAEASRPRPPQKGEEAKLAARLEALERHTAAAAKAFRLRQAEVAASPPDAGLLAKLREAEDALRGLRLEADAIEQRQAEIEAWGKAQAAEKKRREQAAAAAKAAAEKERAAAETERKRAAIRAAWEALVQAAQAYNPEGDPVGIIAAVVPEAHLITYQPTSNVRVQGLFVPARIHAEEYARFLARVGNMPGVE